MSLEKEFEKAHKEAKKEINELEQTFDDTVLDLKETKKKAIETICEKYGVAYATNNDHDDVRVYNEWYMPKSARKFKEVDQEPILKKLYGHYTWKLQDHSEDYDDDNRYYGEWNESGG